MANLTFSGLNGVMDELTRCSDRMDSVVAAMLKAGGDEMVKAWKDAIDAAGLVRTGAMRESVKAGNLQQNGDGGSITVYPRGKDGKGTSNALKAFVNHYGTSRIPATGFVDRAEKDGEEKTVAAMRSVFEQMQH